MGLVDVAYDSRPFRSLKSKETPIDMDVLLKAVKKVYEQIEPWSQASSDEGTIDLMIKGVQIQGGRFSEAIDLSVATSSDGLMLLAEGVLFTRATTQGKPMGEMQPDFGNLIRRANDGCEGVEKSVKILGEVAEKYREISCSTGPVILRGISQGSGRRRKSTVINPDVLGVTRAMGQIMTTGRVPTLVTMPVRLPEPTKVALGINGAYETPPKRRKTENLALSESLSRLWTLANDIAEVQAHMTRVIALWKGIRDKLTRMQSQVGMHGLDVSEFDQEVENDWTEVAAQYKAYRDQMANIREYYLLNFSVDFKEIDFKAKLVDLEKGAQTIRRAAQNMENIVRLTHHGEGRVQFRDSVNLVYQGLQGQVTQLVSLLEGVEKDVQYSGDVSDGDQSTRAQLRDLLEQTETQTPTISFNIQKLEQLLAEQVSKKRLIRARFYQACDWSGSTAAGVFSQEEAMGVLEGFEAAVLSISRFCEVFVLVGIQVDEAVLLEKAEDRNGLTALEEALRKAIEVLKSLQTALSVEEKWDLL